MKFAITLPARETKRLLEFVHAVKEDKRIRRFHRDSAFVIGTIILKRIAANTAARRKKK